MVSLNLYVRSCDHLHAYVIKSKQHTHLFGIVPLGRYNFFLHTCISPALIKSIQLKSTQIIDCMVQSKIKEK